MTQKQTGGPAYPSILFTHDVTENYATHGMTLRDYFAGQALAGISSMSGDEFSLSPKQEADWAYQRADAMIAARNGE